MSILSILLSLPMLVGAQESQPKPNIQPTYADALHLVALEQAYNSGGSANKVLITSEIEDILERYGIIVGPGETKEDFLLQPLIDLLKPDMSASLIKGGIEKGIEGQADKETFAVAPNGQETEIVPSIGWEAAAINALSTFMAKRFKQETIHYGLNQLFLQIKEKDSAIFSTLFPESYKEIVRLRTGESYYSADLVFLRQVVDNDLGRLHERIASNAKTIFPRIPDPAGDVLKIAGMVHRNITTGISLPEVFHRLASEEFMDLGLKKAMEVNYLFSEALRDTLGSGRIWVDLAMLNGPLDASKVRKYFFGLIKEQLNAYLPETEGYEKVEKTKQLLSYFSELNSAARFLANENYRLDQEQGMQLLGLLNSAMATFLLSAQQEGVISVREEYLNMLGKYQTIIGPLATGEYQKALVIILHDMADYLPKGEADNYRRTIVFAVQLAEIQRPEEMEALLQAYALPIGGSTIKRRSNWDVSLNGYVGLTGGWETAYGSSKQTRPNIGLAAPIGISVTYKGRLTAFASIIDIGSIVNVRLNNNTTSFSDLRFEQFLTPGIGLYYNVKTSPFTFGVHYNYISNLRTVEFVEGLAKVTETQVSVSRLNLSVLVDIPFFTLYNKRQEKR